MIEALAPDSADHTLDLSPLPWRSRRTKHLLDAHVSNLLCEVIAKDSITVSQQVARCSVPGESIFTLLGRPFRGRMSRDVEVQDAPPLMGQHQEHIQNLKTDSRHGETVDRNKLPDVVVQKGAPRLGRWFPMADHVLADASLAYVYTPFE